MGPGQGLCDLALGPSLLWAWFPFGTEGGRLYAALWRAG